MRIKFMVIAIILLLFFSYSIPAESISVTSKLVNENIFMPIKIIVSESHIYLFDTADQSLKIFTREGKLIRTMGRKGEGPGELRGATDFWVINDKIYILDSHKIEIFSQKNGKYLSSKRLRTSSSMKFCIDGNNYYVCSLAYRKGDKLIKKYLDKGELELKYINSFLDCTPLENSDNFAPIYENFGCVACLDSKVYFAYLLSNKILEFSENGKLLNQLTVPIRSLDINKLNVKRDGMRMHLDRAVNLELKQVGGNLFLLSNDERGDSLIFKLEDNRFKEKYRMKEKIASFDIFDNEIWTIGSPDGMAIEILAYKIHSDFSQKGNAGK
jgi:hypothetical protein